MERCWGANGKIAPYKGRNRAKESLSAKKINSSENDFF